MESKTARILHLQRLSTDDGPGIRTTVFFKGCPLRCEWCHNPESISPLPQVQWVEDRCICCHTCLEACPNGCLTMSEAGLAIDRARCQACGTCAEACPASAMELLGTVVRVEQLIREVCKDRTFYQTSGGGVTASGGEPLMQPGFVAAFLAGAKAAGISTALDTCGLASRATLDQVLPHVDLLMFDLKEIDPEKHLAFTGQLNGAILQSLLCIQDRISAEALDIRLWIRTPLIPGATATHENLAGLGAFIAQHLTDVVERWELCAFNNLCRDKYRRLGMDWRFKDTPLLTSEELNTFARWARQSGVDPDLVTPTGATRKE